MSFILFDKYKLCTGAVRLQVSTIQVPVSSKAVLTYGAPAAYGKKIIKDVVTLPIELLQQVNIIYLGQYHISRILMIL